MDSTVTRTNLKHNLILRFAFCHEQCKFHLRKILIFDFQRKKFMVEQRGFFSRTPLRTPPGVRNGVLYVLGVRNE